MIMNDYARVKNKKLLNILKQICFSVRKAIKDHSKKFVWAVNVREKITVLHSKRNAIYVRTFNIKWW